jgi:hypothetical protein
MRTVVTAFVAIALIGIWLVTRYSDDSGQVPGVTDQAVMPDSIQQEVSLPVVDQQESQATIPDESVGDTIDSNAVSEPTLQTARIEFAPGMRDKIVDVLSESGLAPTDGGRIADSALAGVGECIELALGNPGGEPTSNQAETCMFNVLADYGLSASSLTEVNLAAVSLP